MAIWTKTETAEAIADLKELLRPGDTVYTTVKSVAKSGMSRTISCYVIKNNEPRWISRLVAKATQSGYDDGREAVKVSGCGMDMGADLVYQIGRALYPDGFGIQAVTGARPQTKNEAIEYMSREIPPVFHGRNGNTSGWDNDGGYALKQRWL